MKSRIVRWGNSLAIRLPRAFLDRAGFAEGSAIEIDAGDGEIVLRQSQASLEDLVARISPENRHSESFADAPRGREAW